MRTSTCALLVSVLSSCAFFEVDRGDDTLLSLLVNNGNDVPAIAWNVDNLAPNPETGSEYQQIIKYYLRGFATEAECNAATRTDIMESPFLLDTQTRHTSRQVTNLLGSAEFDGDPLTPGWYYRAVVMVQANSLPGSPTQARPLPMSSCVQAAN